MLLWGFYSKFGNFKVEVSAKFLEHPNDGEGAFVGQRYFNLLKRTIAKLTIQRFAC
jgi:hypothetical protein